MRTLGSAVAAGLGAILLPSAVGPAQELLRTLLGDGNGGLGTSVAFAGDVDGDGHVDLALAGAAATRMVSGRTNRVLWSVPVAARLAPCGDVDRDGAPDLVVHALGRGAVVSGASGVPLRVLDHGASYATPLSPGDVDGDGVADAAFVMDQPPRLSVWSTAAATRLWQIDLAGSGYANRGAVAVRGDAQGDGVPDVAVIRADRSVAVHDGRSGGVLLTLTPAANPTMLAFVGDRDDDGGDDLALGRSTLGPQFAVAFHSARTGAVLWQHARTIAVLRMQQTGDLDLDGDADLLLHTQVSPDVTGIAIFTPSAPVLWQVAGARWSRFGASVATGGDLDRDGIPDLLVGAPDHDRAFAYSGRSDLLTGGGVVDPVQGGTLILTLRAGWVSAAGFGLVLGSSSGTWPGFDVGHLTVPLALDPYTQWTLRGRRPPLEGGFVRLDSRGDAEPRFRLPPGSPAALYGLDLHHAAVVLAPDGSPTMVSRPVLVRLRALTTLPLHETFADDRQLDRLRSAGGWIGGARGGPIGGDGLHGEFDHALGTRVAQDTWVWDLDAMVIPAARTRSGHDEPLASGDLRFTRFVLPSGVRVLFAGGAAVRIRVCGECRVDGEVVVAGAAVPPGYIGRSSSPPRAGQPGGRGGPGGGGGGRGGDQGDGVSAAPRFAGRGGADVQVAAGHAYEARTAGTGGDGAAQWPASGRDGDVLFSYFGELCVQTPAPGAGGGYRGAGGAGRNLSTSPPPENAPDTPPARAFDPLPLPPGRSSIEHFAIGGSGGGGGGSHTYLARRSLPPYWHAGAGGGGGGGALALRVGGDLTVDGAIDARGGDGGGGGNATTGPASAGGGGAGGTVLLQVAGARRIGRVTALGGSGGDTDVPFGAGSLSQRGGDGAAGYVRLEADGASPGELAGVEPPATAENVGPLLDRDPLVAVQSKWYVLDRSRTALDFPRYVLTVATGGSRLVFSDDPALGPLAAPGTSAPVWLSLQGAVADAAGIVDERSARPWRALAGRRPFEASLSDDDVNAVRFALVFQRAVAAAARVEEVVVEARAR